MTMDRRRGVSPRGALLVRCGIGLAITLGLAYAIFHVVFRTGVLASALACVGAVKDFIGWVAEDAGRAWSALEGLIAPHIRLVLPALRGPEVRQTLEVKTMLMSARVTVALSLTGGLGLACSDLRHR
ncbi:hypothetical protein [Streptomyces sp. NPDC059788]|uniref:hypothetical protein n=1 Tax=Streptomyces sp. NPDC059788 TaxID=3346948 RepID=UPI0036500186